MFRFNKLRSIGSVKCEASQCSILEVHRWKNWWLLQTFQYKRVAKKLKMREWLLPVKSRSCYTTFWALQSTWYGWNLSSDAHEMYRILRSNPRKYFPSIFCSGPHRMIIQTKQISLPSFSLKCLQRLFERRIHQKARRSHPLNENQNAYERRKSSESAFDSLVSKNEDAIL